MFRTMLVEDSTSFRQVVKNSLQDQFPSMDIIEAGDGVEAFQKIDSHPPNLIFMDIQLPGEDGLELTRKVKADYPEIIIIILTNHDLPEYREAATRNKADYFFAKNSIATDGIFKLVKTILLEKGFNADGSDSKKKVFVTLTFENPFSFWPTFLSPIIVFFWLIFLKNSA